MKGSKFRIKDDPNIWAKLPRKRDDALDYLYQKLIEENGEIMALADKKACSPFDEDVRKKVNPAQEVLLLLHRLDSEILCGGVTQLIWNLPWEFDVAGKAIRAIGETDLAKLYKKATDRAEEKFDDWEALWVKGNDVSGETKKQCFLQTYPLLDLKWFDTAYLKKHRAKMVDALLAFVVKKKDQFVSPAQR